MVRSSRPKKTSPLSLAGSFSFWNGFHYLHNVHEDFEQWLGSGKPKKTCQLCLVVEAGNTT